MGFSADVFVHGYQLAHETVLHFPLVVHQPLQPSVLLRLHGGVHLSELGHRC